MIETQVTINNWADSTFGYASFQSSLRRVLEEIEELRDINPLSTEKVIDKCADILITLYRLANVMGYNLHACVDHKMMINRARKWKSNGDGTGQHIEETK